MGGLIWALSIIVLLVLIGMVPLRVWAALKGGKFAFSVSLWLFKLFALPKTEKGEKSKKSKKSAKKAPKKEGQKKKLKLSFELVRKLLEKAAKIPGMITLEHADVTFIAAGGNDPFRAAMLYGGGWAAQGILNAAINRAFKKVRSINYRSDVDYDACEDVFEFDARIHIRLWQLLVFAAGLLGIVMMLAKNAPKDERSKADGEE